MITYEQFLESHPATGDKEWGRTCWNKATQVAIAECNRIVGKDWRPVINQTVNDLVEELNGIEAAIASVNTDK